MRPSRTRPDERFTLTVERKGRRIRVKTYIYSGDELVATTSPWSADMVDEAGRERSIYELVEASRGQLCAHTKLWAEQFSLF